MAYAKFQNEGQPLGDFKICHDRVRLRTQKRVQFIDLSELVRERVRRAEIRSGIVNVHTRHTTTGVVLNENEHHLLRDFEDRLEAWAPREASYRHNDLEARSFQLIPETERPNGDAHARALLLGASETMNVIEGGVDFGEWQRLFLVELDGPRERSVSLMILGTLQGSLEWR
ncbi:MAG: secondary thiamine-phosphate synthase enzyme YjbQ [Vicinamibacteria bacterium]